MRLTQEDEFLILASDGVWDTVPNDDAVGLVKDTVKDPAMVRGVTVCDASWNGWVSRPHG